MSILERIGSPMNCSIFIPDLVQELLKSSTEGIEQLTAKLSHLISSTILITDPRYQVLTSSFPPETNMIDSIFAIQQLESAKDTTAFSCQLTTTTTEEFGVATPILHESKTLGYVFILTKNKTINLGSYASLLNFFASLCAIQLQKKLELRQERMKFKEAFLFDLLYGNIKQREDILEYGKVWDWNLTIPQTAIVFSLNDFNHVSTDKQLIKTLLYIVERNIVERDIKPITMMRQNQVTAIFSIDGKENSVELRSSIETFSSNVINQMKLENSDREFSCGIGKTYNSPVDIFRSFQEAKVALELGQLINIPIPFFSDLGLERILYKHDLQDLKEYYHSTLGELIHYDESNNAQLMETLEGLVANQFDMTATSKALFLHRNTLRYRLKKIEEILNLKLDDLNNKLNISAALKIKLLRKI
jgi:PucR family transcriptional regulator, purine catabolism regulatory protein